ncbi:cytokine receptor common subunit beta [Aulostomus maculatus]
MEWLKEEQRAHKLLMAEEKWRTEIERGRDKRPEDGKERQMRGIKRRWRFQEEEEEEEEEEGAQAGWRGLGRLQYSRADEDSFSQASSLLESLHCHNDYESYVQCEWREDPHLHTPLQLWFQRGKNREPCVPYSAPVQDGDELRISQCQYKTNSFRISTKHTVLFLKNQTVSSSKPLDLSQHLRARPPVGFSSHATGDEGRLLTWSSPYPSSSSLNLMYSLSYRAERQDNWTIKEVISTAVKLEKRLLLPGVRYEARVRGRTRVGQWSDWSPVVTWRTEEDSRQGPSLHCVVDGEKEVVCSWEVSRELDHFITYQLACQHYQAGRSERCCVNYVVDSDPSGMVMRYSCSLTASDPAHLLLELLPTHRTRTFMASKHIRPNPPHQVKVRKEGNSWIVEWTKPSTAVTLYYQVCYCRTKDQGSSVLLNIPEGAMSLSIPNTNLTPSQYHQVRVRSLVVPGEGSLYEGTPSDWTVPVFWKSDPATWSISGVSYFVVSAFVTFVFLFTLYCAIPACQRRVVLWKDSVPSPGKSKILSDFKYTSNQTSIQREQTSICKVQKFDSFSTCSSSTPLWLNEDTAKKASEQDKSCWDCNNPPSPVERVNGSDPPADFSGPYFFFQSSNPILQSVDYKCEESDTKEEETPADVCASPSSVKFVLYGQGYVCLPNGSIFRSTRDTSTHSAEQVQQHQDNTLCPDKPDLQPSPSEPTRSPHPSAYTSAPSTPWPTVNPSGYYLLPTVLTEAAN